MDPTPKRRATFLPAVLALCAATLLGGCVVAPYYDAYGNPVAVAPAAYPAYPYDYYYGPAYYPARLRQPLVRLFQRRLLGLPPWLGRPWPRRLGRTRLASLKTPPDGRRRPIPHAVQYG